MRRFFATAVLLFLLVCLVLTGCGARRKTGDVTYPVSRLRQLREQEEDDSGDQSAVDISESAQHDVDQDQDRGVEIEL